MWLGIETSSLVSSVALLDQDILLGEITMQAGLTHSEQLVPHIALLLEQACVDRSELTGIVVSIGPGSFTGLRIGMGTAKAMAYALNIPLYGVMTMEGMAYNLPMTDRKISVVIDAQKKNVYEAVYEWQGNDLVCLQEPTVKAAVDLWEEILQEGRPRILLGDGLKRLDKVIDRELLVDGTPLVTVANPTVNIPSASSLLWAAKQTPGGLKPADPMTLIPYYNRRSEAEVMWDEKHKDNPEMLAQNPQVTVIETVQK